jgi:hypothetical protein
MEWSSGPVAVRVRDLPFPVVALPASYHMGPESNIENEQDVLVLPRQGVKPVLALLKTLTKPDGIAQLKVGNGEVQLVSRM